MKTYQLAYHGILMSGIHAAICAEAVDEIFKLSLADGDRVLLCFDTEPIEGSIPILILTGNNAAWYDLYLERKNPILSLTHG